MSASRGDAKIRKSENLVRWRIHKQWAKLPKLILIPIIAVVDLSGCASIVGNSSYPVAISSDPSGARFIITNEGGNEVQRGTTPATVTLKSSAGYFDGEKYSVTFSKDGSRDAFATLDSGISGWYIGNLLFGGLLGFLIVDPLTGAMYNLPESVSASLTKIPVDSAFAHKYTTPSG